MRKFLEDVIRKLRKNPNYHAYKRDRKNSPQVGKWMTPNYLGLKKLASDMFKMTEINPVTFWRLVSEKQKIDVCDDSKYVKEAAEIKEVEGKIFYFVTFLCRVSAWFKICVLPIIQTIVDTLVSRA